MTRAEFNKRELKGWIKEQYKSFADRCFKRSQDNHNLKIIFYEDCFEFNAKSKDDEETSFISYEDIETFKTFKEDSYLYGLIELKNKDKIFLWREKLNESF